VCVCVCVCVCVSVRAVNRAHRRVQVRARVWPCSSSMQRVCAILNCHLWLLWHHRVFRHYVINGTVFGGEKKLLNTKCVFWFSAQLLSETFLILRRTWGDTVINVKRSSCKVPVILVRFQWNLKSSRQIFQKRLNIKFHQNPSSGSRVVPCGRTDGRKDRRTWGS
jgi:hypothetical protein